MKSCAGPILCLAALSLLSGCGGDSSPETPAEWAAWLSHEDIQRRYEAATRLSEMGAAAVPALEARLMQHVGRTDAARPSREREADPRELAAQALMLIGEPALPTLLRALGCEEDYERDLAGTALARMQLDEEALDGLVALMASENPLIAGRAAGVLAAPGHVAGRARLAELVRDAEDLILARRAIRALGAEPDADVYELADLALTYEDFELTNLAIQVLSDAPETEARRRAMADQLDDQGVLGGFARAALKRWGRSALPEIEARAIGGDQAEALGAIDLLAKPPFGEMPAARAFLSKLGEEGPEDWRQAAARAALREALGQEDGE